MPFRSGCPFCQPQHPLVDQSAHDVVDPVVLFQRVPVPVTHDPPRLDPAYGMLRVDPDLGAQPVERLFCVREPLSRFSPDCRNHFHVLAHLLRHRVAPVRMGSHLPPPPRAVPGRQAGRKRRGLHPVRPNVVGTSRRMPSVVHDQAVCVHGVLHLGRVSFPLP